MRQGPGKHGKKWHRGSLLWAPCAASEGVLWRTPQHDWQVYEALCDQLPEAWPRQARLDRQKPRVLYHLHICKAPDRGFVDLHGQPWVAMVLQQPAQTLLIIRGSHQLPDLSRHWPKFGNLCCLHATQHRSPCHTCRARRWSYRTQCARQLTAMKVTFGLSGPAHKAPRASRELCNTSVAVLHYAESRLAHRVQLTGL